MEREEVVELDALLEVVNSLEASDVFHEVKIAVGVDARANKTMPVDALQFDVCVVLLERKVQGLAKVDVWALNGVHVLARHVELCELKVLGEHLHFLFNY